MFFFRLVTDDITLAKQNTALVFDSCSIILGSGDIVCYQPQTIQYYIIAQGSNCEKKCIREKPTRLKCLRTCKAVLGRSIYSRMG